MPELPDLLYIRKTLAEALVGRVVTAERVKDPVVLRFAVKVCSSSYRARTSPVQRAVKASSELDSNGKSEVEKANCGSVRVRMKREKSEEV